MNKRPLTIFAIDLGTQSLRLSAFLEDGTRLWSCSTPMTSTVRGEVYTQDPREWEEALHTALQKAGAEGLRPDAIAATGPLAGWVPMDSRGQSLSPAVLYLDGRAAPDVEAVRDAVAQAGDRSSFRTTLADPLPNLLRLRREEVAIAERTTTLLDATGWLNFFLTGKRTINPYTALRLYSQEVQKTLHVRNDLFGQVVAAGTEIGTLKEELAQRYGFLQVPVYSAPFDSKCAYLAAGLSQPGEALDISGTVTSVGVYAAEEVGDPQRRVYSVPFADGWLVRGSTACSGSVITWAEEHLLHADVDAWTEKASAVSPGAQGVTFLPYLAGERTPHWNPKARGALLGVGLDTTDAVIGRAVLESLAFSLRHVLDCMQECGVSISSLRLSGGLAQNDLLSQIKADVLGLKVYRLANHELTSLGLVAICKVGLGRAKDFPDAAERLVSVGDMFVPSHEAAKPYAAAYQRYRRSVDALLPTFQADVIF